MNPETILALLQTAASETEEESDVSSKNARQKWKYFN
jgi:hypothetical protein